jgi:hypothetical protein
VTRPDPDPRRTPAELCKQALKLADSSQSQLQALRAITTAIVGLAGEVNRLGKQSIDLRVNTITADILAADVLATGMLDDDLLTDDDDGDL